MMPSDGETHGGFFAHWDAVRSVSALSVSESFLVSAFRLRLREPDEAGLIRVHLAALVGADRVGSCLFALDAAARAIEAGQRCGFQIYSPPCDCLSTSEKSILAAIAAAQIGHWDLIEALATWLVKRPHRRGMAMATMVLGHGLEESGNRLPWRTRIAPPSGLVPNEPSTPACRSSAGCPCFLPTGEMVEDHRIIATADDKPL